MAISTWSRMASILEPLKARSEKAASRYSPSALLLSGVAVLAFALGVAVLIQEHYFGNDVISTLTYISNDGFCDLDANEGIGGHCFGDYRIVANYALESNPWDNSTGVYNNYPAGSMLPHALFGGLGELLQSPLAGLVLYLTAMGIAMSVPALWASQGKPLFVRVVTVGLFGFGSVPALMAFDRGNSVGLAVPAMLGFLVALQREKYRTVVIAIILATLIKPQYALLVIALVAARQWRFSGYTLVGVAVSNVAAFLVWPRHFPGEILQAFQNTFHYGGDFGVHVVFPSNMSLANGLYVVLGAFGDLSLATRASTWVAANAGLVGMVLAAAIGGVVALLGRRLPQMIGASLLLMTASLFPGISWPYYVVFVLPVAAVLLRDPAGPPPTHEWRGALDAGGLTRFQNIAVMAFVVTTIGSVSRVILPHLVTPGGWGGNPGILASTGDLVPVMWLLTAALCALAWSTATPERRAASVAAKNPI